MRLGFILKSFIRPSALNNGCWSPGLSLTSDNGGWVRSNDYIDRKNIVILFIKCLERQERVDWLKSFEGSLSLFQQNECEIFAVLSENTVKLREYSDLHSINIPLLYDPLSIDARRFGMGTRILRSVDGCVYINKDGIVENSWRSRVDPNEVLDCIRDEQPASTVDKRDDVEWIDSKSAIEKLKAGFKIVDVRTQSEYDADHVPDSIHMPIEMIQGQYGQLPQNRRLIFICQAGGRAWSAAEFMSSIGSSELFVVKGGMSAWNGERVTGGETQ